VADMLNRIGLELECWLLKGNKIVEPQLYGFPFDEYGFLIEIRTHPHSTVKDLLEEFNCLWLSHKARAEALGLRLVIQPRRFLGKNLINCLKQKYGWDVLPDLTANVYSGIRKSHATGVDVEYGTAALHVHFSSHDKKGRRVQLPIREIVFAMDARFNEVVAKAKRIHGEFEIKVHGFEYRSLPATVNIKEVVEFAFHLLECYREFYV